MEIGCYSAAVVGKTLKEKLEALQQIGYDFLELTLRQEDVDALKQLGDIPADFAVDRLFMPDITKVVD